VGGKNVSEKGGRKCGGEGGQVYEARNNKGKGLDARIVVRQKKE